MPPADHDRAQDKLAHNMPPAAEAVGLVWQPNTDADAAVAGDDLENNVEDRVRDWIAVELASFSDHNEEHREHDPPQVMS